MSNREYPNQTVAIVVTHLRHDLLKRCLSALVAQSAGCDVLVINNSPGDLLTSQVIKEFVVNFQHISSHDMKNNLGGAGGFRKGMEIALSKGYDYLWLLDDDAFPDVTCLEVLLSAARHYQVDSAGREIGFYCSLAVTEFGETCKANLPVFSSSPLSHIKEQSHNLEVEQCSFVSVLFHKSVVQRAGLPVAQMFIGCDDLEYTRRIAKFIGFGILSLGSVVRHSESAKVASQDQPITAKSISRKKREFENYFATLLAHGRYWKFVRNISAYFVGIMITKEKRKYLLTFLLSLFTIPVRRKQIKAEFKDL